MSEHDLEKLLGGFAANTLTPEETQSLYAAALQDQQLFNALANEQALKELLSDPDVRRRLLTALEQKRDSDTGNVLAWLEWFRRPASLAFAGGLTAAAFAMVLGIRMYQDSLKESAPSVATEVAKLASPSVSTPPASQLPAPQHAEPQAKVRENVGLQKDVGKKERLLDSTANREQAAPPTPQEHRPPNTARRSAMRQTEQDGADKKANAPLPTLGRSPENFTSSANPTVAASSAQPAATLASKQMETPAVSARALFYSADQARQSQGRTAPEKERAMKPLAESAPQTNQPEGKLEGYSQLGKAVGAVVPLKPLGLRYSFVVREADGQEREVDVGDVSKRTQTLFLTLEANQAAYLQVWKTVDPSTAELQLPGKETGLISLKITAGQRQYMHLPEGREPATLTVRLSLAPFGPITRQDAAQFDRPSSRQIRESITDRNQSESQERATYVVNQDLSPSAQITVDIILGQ